MSFSVQGQTLKQYVKFADENMQKGDYYYAIENYKKAMDIDSSSVEINWKIAEAYRLYKDYQKAEYYYAKVYGKEDARIYPRSIYWLATMQKMNRKPSESFKSWKIAKRKLIRQRREFVYQKAEQETRSALWARKNIGDSTEWVVERFDKVNTYDTEFAPTLKDSILYVTTLRGDSVNTMEEVFYEQDYRTTILQNDLTTTQASQKFPPPQIEGFNIGNGTFSPDGKRFYFSRCDDSYQCKIFITRYENDKWSAPDSLGRIINEEGFNTTMPHITHYKGQEYLFFVSNKEEGQGGLDIWYSKVYKDGNQYMKPRNAGRYINTPGNEISPFFNPSDGYLYFSSDWHYGLGGMDIFKATGFPERFEKPENLLEPINSSVHDTYYIYDSISDQVFFSSNRIGTLSKKTPTCCNDIFVAHIPKLPEPTPEETLEELNERLPVTLYFHNDEPDPKTRDTTTDLNYMATYDAYVDLKPQYKKEYSSGLNGEEALFAKEDIEDFFTEFVDQGVADLELFSELLLKELEKGIRIRMTVKGFASPLAKTDYNVNLTKRRISSMVNYLRAYQDGVYRKYLDGTAENGGILEIVQVPFGEYEAEKLVSDNFHDQRNSVYSRAAMRERKIEIQSLSLIKKDDKKGEGIVAQPIKDFGKTNVGQHHEHTFMIKNRGSDTLKLLEMELPCDCVTADIENVTLAPGESSKVTVKFDPTIVQGLIAHKVKIKTDGIPEIIELSITAEVFE